MDGMALGHSCQASFREWAQSRGNMSNEKAAMNMLTCIILHSTSIRCKSAKVIHFIDLFVLPCVLCCPVATFRYWCIRGKSEMWYDELQYIYNDGSASQTRVVVSPFCLKGQIYIAVKKHSFSSVHVIQPVKGWNGRSRNRDTFRIISSIFARFYPALTCMLWEPQEVSVVTQLDAPQVMDDPWLSKSHRRFSHSWAQMIDTELILSRQSKKDDDLAWSQDCFFS